MRPATLLVLKKYEADEDAETELAGISTQAVQLQATHFWTVCTK